jgi:hypothetical protein
MKALIKRGLVATVAVAGLVAGTAGSGQAATNTWYGIPSSQGGAASVNMTYFNKSNASGTAGGQIWVSNPTSNSLYVQRKPNEGGLWKRSTPNVPRAAAGRGYFYNWSDSFTLNYSGYMFRICKDNSIVGDTCGPTIQVRG